MPAKSSWLLAGGEALHQPLAFGLVAWAVNGGIRKILGRQFPTESPFEVGDAKHSLNARHHTQPKRGVDEVVLMNLARVYPAINAQKPSS